MSKSAFRAFRPALLWLALAAALWLPARLVALAAGLPLPPPDYRYGAAAQLTLLLRAAGFAAALAIAVIAVGDDGAAGPAVRLRCRRLGARLLLRGAAGLLLAGLLALGGERQGAPPWLAHPAVAAGLCLLVGSGLFAEGLAGALAGRPGVTPRGAAVWRTRLVDAAPALLCGWLAQPQPVPPAILALGPLAPWLLPLPLQGPGPWLALGATTCWLQTRWRGGRAPALGHRPRPQD